ncbi:hypothetical protein E4U42_005074 [Claviceps africana]|uniref:Uncharacterized protein n=1 Tax=Claviceps africana TaxID=83212 RepID=A0A8K0J454_9HYPO|nr:hypothetical protein E4U42_005074 [Claviceps africana]
MIPVATKGSAVVPPRDAKVTAESKSRLEYQKSVDDAVGHSNLVSSRVQVAVVLEPRIRKL